MSAGNPRASQVQIGKSQSSPQQKRALQSIKDGQTQASKHQAVITARQIGATDPWHKLSKSVRTGEER
jgi:hypothetical protein